jgi:hypothetical protein
MTDAWEDLDLSDEEPRLLSSDEEEEEEEEEENGRSEKSEPRDPEFEELCLLLQQQMQRLEEEEESSAEVLEALLTEPGLSRPSGLSHERVLHRPRAVAPSISERKMSRGSESSPAVDVRVPQEEADGFLPLPVHLLQLDVTPAATVSSGGKRRKT